MTPRADRRALRLLVGVFSALYLYFFQGGGWNQNSHFDTIRAIVEQGSTAITTFASNTGDVGAFKGRIYSNKPPGLAYLGAPVYFVAYHLEPLLGISPDAPTVVNANAHILTFVTSGLPAVGVLVFLYLAWRREGATIRESLSLATMFGAGSLMLPYAGVMMSHSLDTLLLFGAWYSITSATPARWPLLAAGLLTGMAILTDFMAAPVAALYALYLLWRRLPARQLTVFLVGPLLMAGLLLLHNYLNFENPFVTNYSIRASAFRQEHLLFAMLGWPEPMRLIWLTVHPFRGLFYCCPVLLISLLAPRWPLRPCTLSADRGLVVSIVLYFALFNLTFSSWTGGWGIGPRYFIPALPFLFLFALAGFRRFPVLSAVLAVISAAVMLSVTAVRVMIPAPNFGPPPDGNPVLYCLRELLAGRVSVSVQSMLENQPTLSGHDQWDSYNLGEVVGLPGVWSLLPVALLLVGVTVVILKLTPDGGAAAGRPPRQGSP